MPKKTANELLKDAFKPTHVDAAVGHFQKMVAITRNLIGPTPPQRPPSSSKL
jgi:hypothetical protein